MEVPTALIVGLLRAVGGSVVLNDFELTDPKRVEIEAYETDGPKGRTVTVRIKPDDK